MRGPPAYARHSTAQSPAMLAIFESILPIFLLIVIGNLLRRTPLVTESGWRGLEDISYWVLYPVLLFVTVVRADFSGLQLDAMLAALLAAILLMAGFVLALWLPLSRSGAVTGPEFSSFFQTAMRWNSFIALAVAQELYAAEGLAVVALVMTVIIIPLNVLSVSVVSRFGTRRAQWSTVAWATARNPFILAILIGLAFRYLPDLYQPVTAALDLIGSAAIGLGLLSIGAGLRPADMLRPRFTMWLSVAIKLVLMPAVIFALAYLFGVRGPVLVYLVLCGAVPTAMNGYMLARQLGGDAEDYAAVATIQTALAVLTMPLALALTAQFSSG